MSTFQLVSKDKLLRKEYEHIGKIIYHFSLLDLQLVDILGLILGLNRKQRRLAFCRSDFKGKLGVLKTLASKWVLDRDLRGWLNELVSAMFQLEEARNLYAHSTFGMDSKSPGGETFLIHVGSADQRHLPDAQPIKIVELAHEPDAFVSANQAAAKIIRFLRLTRDNPKILKQSFRQPEPEKPLPTHNATQ